MFVTPSIQHYGNSHEFITGVTAIVENSIASSLQHKSDTPTYVALSGGSTPKEIYHKLSQKDLDWSRVHAIAGDERIVAAQSEDFNGKMIVNSLLQNKAKNCQFTAFDMQKNSLSAYQQIVQNMLPLDVCILGMGADCHTASIFHDADNLQQLIQDSEKQYLIETASPRMPQKRISLTMPVLQQSKEIHLLIKGKEKYQALNQALQAQSCEQFPVLGIASLAQTTIHYY